MTRGTQDATVTLDVASIDHVLRTTRAVRRRLDLERPIPREVITECLELAMQAPTGGNRQPWRWIVVTDPRQRERLGAIYRRALSFFRGEGDPPPGILDALAAHRESVSGAAEAASDGRAGLIGQSAQHLAAHITEVPALVVPCISGPLPERPNAFQLATFFGSAFPGIWSFQLALRSRNIGSSLTTAHLLLEDEVAEVLELPPELTQIALLPIGYILGGDLRPASRMPAAEVTSWDRWGGT